MYQLQICPHFFQSLTAWLEDLQKWTAVNEIPLDFILYRTQCMMASSSSDRRSMLCVGHVCVDLINLCSHYPEEDAKVGTTTANNRWLLWLCFSSGQPLVRRAQQRVILNLFWVNLQAFLKHVMKSTLMHTNLNLTWSNTVLAIDLGDSEWDL